MSATSFPISMSDLHATLSMFPTNMEIVVATQLAGAESGALLHSWRGDYAEPAIEPGSEVVRTVGEFALDLRQAMNGRVFIGWKGGEFTFHKDDPIRISRQGHADEQFVVGVALHLGRLWIQSDGVS